MYLLVGFGEPIYSLELRAAMGYCVPRPEVDTDLHGIPLAKRREETPFSEADALATLDEADINVVSPTEPDAGDRSFRELVRPILAWLAERYSEELSRNVVRGMRSQAEKCCRKYGQVLYGYAV
jgi:hypothetical protein